MQDLSGVPQCGIACLASSLSVSACAAVDTACLCADQGFTDFVTSCVMSNCTIRESLVVKNATWSGCGFPEPNQDTSIIVVTAVVLSLQTIVFGLRMLCRAVRIAPWGWDDTTIVVAFVLTIGFAAASVIERHAGLGRNIWTLQPDQVTRFLEVFYIFESIYSCVLAIIKISICFLYLRIFPGPRFRVVVWATQAFNVALLIAFQIVDGFQCRPISLFWEGWDGQEKGQCLNLNAFAWAHASINIVLDVWMLALPASQVWSLNLPMRKKAGVLAMFGFGILLTIISIIRLQSLRAFDHTSNPTRDLYGVAIWSAVEITAGLIVACMPAARLFLVHYVPRLFSSTRWRLTSNAHTPHSGDKSSTASPTSARTLSNRLHKKISLSPLSSKDLDKNRRYSMHVTITSTGQSGSSGPDHSPQEKTGKGIRISDFPQEPGSAKLPPPGEYLGLPERLLTPNESQMERSKIWVTQGVSVTRETTADPLRSHAVQYETSETDKTDL